MKILAALATAFLAVDQFAARYWRQFVLVGATILGLLTLRACYEAGKYQNAVQQNPPLTRRDVAHIKAVIRTLKVQARQARHQEDSAVVVATAHQQRADQSQHQVDSLTHLYDQVPASVARYSDAELFRHLAGYRPAPFPDTSASPGSGY